MAALYRMKDQTDAGEVLQVWVAPEFRGKQVAWDLMDVIFKWAGDNNFRRIMVGVTKANPRALKFYKNYGFSVMEEAVSNLAEGISLVKKVQ